MSEKPEENAVKPTSSTEPSWVEVSPGVKSLQGGINEVEAMELMEERRYKANGSSVFVFPTEDSTKDAEKVAEVNNEVKDDDVDNEVKDSPVVEPIFYTVKVSADDTDYGLMAEEQDTLFTYLPNTRTWYRSSLLEEDFFADKEYLYSQVEKDDVVALMQAVPFVELEGAGWDYVQRLDAQPVEDQRSNDSFDLDFPEPVVADEDAENMNPTSGTPVDPRSVYEKLEAARSNPGLDDAVLGVPAVGKDRSGRLNPSLKMVIIFSVLVFFLSSSSPAMLTLIPLAFIGLFAWNKYVENRQQKRHF